MDNQIKEMRLTILKDISDQSKDETFELMLNRAKSMAFNILYPFQETLPTTLPNRYTDWQTRCATELYNNRNTEGFTSYSENQLNWTKKTDGVSNSLLSELTPFAYIPRDTEYVS